MEIKKCNECQKEYPATLEFFHASKSGKNGLNSKCKKCKNKRNSYNQTKKKNEKLSLIPPIINLEGEIWKDIKDYEGFYQVSNFGRIKSLDRIIESKCEIKQVLKGRILKSNPDGGGYLTIMLSKNSIQKRMKVHILVAKMFIQNPMGLPQINHKDEDKNNNCVNNLEWCTAKYNANYGTRNERSAKSKGLAKVVYQYSLNGKFIKKWSSTNKCSKFGFFSSNVSTCCRGRYKQYKGYIWSYTPLSDESN